MKTAYTLCLVAILLLAGSAQAQLTMNITIGTPPQWGPLGVTGVRYYYLPAIETYYDIQTNTFIYLNGGNWINRYNLPARYRSYDLYYGYKVILTDYQGNAPYFYFKQHRVKYNKNYRGIPQKTIGEKPGIGNSKPKHGHNGAKAKKGK